MSLIKHFTYRKENEKYPQPVDENAREWLNTDSPPKITPNIINVNFLERRST